MSGRQFNRAPVALRRARLERRVGTLTGKGQITLPARQRRALGWGQGTKLVVEVTNAAGGAFKLRRLWPAGKDDGTSRSTP